MKSKAATALAKGSATDVAREIVARVDAQLGGVKPVLVVAMASLDQPLSELMPKLHAAYPDALVLGSSTAGEFTESAHGDGSTSVFALAGDFKAYGSFASGLKANGEKAVSDVIAALPTTAEGFPHRTGLLFMDAFALSGEEATLTASALLGEDVPLAGGAAGDGFKMMNSSWVGCGSESGSDAIVAAMLFSKVPIGMGVCHGHTPLSQPMRVTKAEGGVVFEIEGQPAFDVWDRETRTSPLRERLKDITVPGLDGLNGFFGIFELGLANGTEFKIRAPLVKLDGGAMGFACGIPEGTVIRIMESTPLRQIDSAREAARRARIQMGEHKPVAALVIDCACRKLLLLDKLGDAVSAMRSELGGVPIAGFESYGEIALKAGDMSGFHNTTTVLLAFP